MKTFLIEVEEEEEESQNEGRCDVWYNNKNVKRVEVFWWVEGRERNERSLSWIIYSRLKSIRFLHSTTHIHI